MLLLLKTMMLFLLKKEKELLIGQAEMEAVT
jgi:hypothetical protein